MLHLALRLTSHGRSSLPSSQGCIDKHYSSIAKSAMETNPADQSPADGAKEAFKAKFSSTWEEAPAG